MTIDPNTGVISWTPSITQTGAQNVTVIASDGHGGAASQTFSINVSAAEANGAPNAQDDLYAVRRGETLTVPAPGVLQNDSDPDGQSLTSVLVTNPTKGTLNFAADGSFNYTPACAATEFDGAGAEIHLLGHCCVWRYAYPADRHRSQ